MRFLRVFIILVAVGLFSYCFFFIDSSYALAQEEIPVDDDEVIPFLGNSSEFVNLQLIDLYNSQKSLLEGGMMLSGGSGGSLAVLSTTTCFASSATTTCEVRWRTWFSDPYFTLGDFEWARSDSSTTRFYCTTTFSGFFCNTLTDPATSTPVSVNLTAQELRYVVILLIGLLMIGIIDLVRRMILSKL